MAQDLHMHSRYSFDGTDEIAALCDAAIARGLDTIAITDHWDACKNVGGDPYYAQYDAIARTAVMDARERYSGRLKILYGIETGQPHHAPDDSRKLIKSHDFDFVIGSVHVDAHGLDYYFQSKDTTDVDAMLEGYYAAHLEMIAFGGFHTVGHLDYPVRMLIGRLPQPARMLAHRDIIAEVLKAAVKKGIYIEINTNGLRRWYGRLTPEDWVLRLYRDLGGRFVTIGSDAHFARDVGAGVREAETLAAACGLDVAYGFDAL